MNKILIIAVSVYCLFFSACIKKEVPDYAALLGRDYYPLTVGKYIIYEVDSTVYTEIPRDTLVYSYQLKEKITEVFTDETGNAAHRLERFVRLFHPSQAYNKLPWRLRDVWVIRGNNQRIEVQENNIRFTRLSFPIEESASWNCNATNTLSAQFCRYEELEKPLVLNQVSHEKTLNVNQLDDINLIEARRANEMYGKGIGLIFKESIAIKGNKIEAGKTVFQRIESGYIYKQTLLSHGVE